MFGYFALLLTVGFGVWGLAYCAIVEFIKWYELQCKFRPFMWQCDVTEVDVQPWGSR